MLAARICSNFPQHTTYVEPFLGGGAVFWLKERSQVEVINDLNRLVVNFYEQMKTNYAALNERVQGTLHSRSAYRDALAIYEHPHLFRPIDLAWAFYVATNQGYAGKIGTWGYGTTSPASEKKLLNNKTRFTPELSQRLDRVQIECDDALRIIKLRDRDTTFFYCDPPYHNANMGHYSGYTEADFIALLDALSTIQGRFLLSSYQSDVLSTYICTENWYSIEIEMPLCAGKKGKKKVEVLTANYPIT